MSRIGHSGFLGKDIPDRRNILSKSRKVTDHMSAPEMAGSPS